MPEFPWVMARGSIGILVHPGSIRVKDKLLLSGLKFCHDWKTAASKEIPMLEGKGTWLEVSITEAKGKALPRTWEFCRKRTPFLAEVCHWAHFWVSYGRCTMPGSPMGRSEGLSIRWTG